MSVFVDIEKGTCTNNSGTQTADKRDEVDLDYCLKRVLSSGYSIDTAHHTPDRAPLSSDYRFGTPTPDREMRRRYPDSPPILYPYNANTSIERGSHTPGTYSGRDQLRPRYDTTLTNPLRRPSRVSFEPELQSTPSYYNHTVKPSADVPYQTIRSDIPAENSTSVFPSQSFSSNCNAPPYRLPKLPQFSGEHRNEEVEFVVWKYEVNCLVKSGIYSEHCILESIRNSLKGKARSVLVHLGEMASVSEIMREMDGTYGNVATPERLKEQFYSASQLEGESIVDFSLRLEHLLCDTRIDLDRSTRDEMLRSRLWSGLRDQVLKNATRYKYETVPDYTSLRRELRQVDEEMKAAQIDKTANVKPGVMSRNRDSNMSRETDVRQYNTAYESRILKELETVTAQMKALNTRVSNIEKELEESKKYRNRSGRWDSRGQGNRNQDKGDNPTSKPNPSSSSSQEKPLNSQNPPQKGQ